MVRAEADKRLTNVVTAFLSAEYGLLQALVDWAESDWGRRAAQQNVRLESVEDRRFP